MGTGDFTGRGRSETRAWPAAGGRGGSESVQIRKRQRLWSQSGRHPEDYQFCGVKA